MFIFASQVSNLICNSHLIFIDENNELDPWIAKMNVIISKLIYLV